MNEAARTHVTIRVHELETEVKKLKKIQRTLMDRVERSMDGQGSAFSLFQTATALEAQVQARTVALEQTVADLEKSYHEVAKAREDAETARHRLLAALEATNEGFALFNSADTLILFNRPYLQFWPGIADKIKIGMKFAEIARMVVDYKCVVDAYREPESWLEKRTAQHALGEASSVHALSDGRWMQVNEKRTGDGGIVGVYTDITSLKQRETLQREAELAKQTSLLQATLDNLFQGVAVYDQKLSLVAWNYEFLRLLDLPHRCVSRNANFIELRRFIEAASGGKRFDPPEFLDPGAHLIPLKFEYIWHNGRVFDIERNRMPDGGFILTFTDITSRKRIEHALRDGERRIRLITDATPALIAYVDSGQHYQFVNQAYREWLGLPVEQILGRKMEDVVAAEMSDRRKDYVVRALEGELVDFEIELTHSGADRPRYAKVTFVPHRGEGLQILGFFTLMHDITERRDIEAALREANEGLEYRVGERTEALTQLNAQLQQEIAERRDIEAALQIAKSQAEQANLSKTRFLAAASHDLLQPLNSARLFASALADLERNKQKSALIDNLQSSMAAVEDLLGTLLDISKLDAGAVSPEITDFPISTLLNPLSTEHAVLAREKNLGLRHVPSSAIVRSDIRLLRRIIQNFLTNAIRYTQKGSILLGCRRRGNSLAIEVWDTGSGIEPEKLSEIFEEFRQLHPATDGSNVGMGLGLAIVERAARMLDLPLQTRSVLGKGSVFSVLVPMGSMADPKVWRTNAGINTGRMSNALIVVIDDQPTILSGMQALLSGWGCQVFVAISGREALDMLPKLPGRPDVVIADYHLGANATGLNEIAKIRKASKQMLPGIVITADHTPEVHNLVKDSGCWLLKKPLNPAQLRSLLANILKSAGIAVT